MFRHIVVIVLFLCQQTLADDVHCACAKEDVLVYRNASDLTTQYAEVPAGVCISYNGNLHIQTLGNTTWARVEVNGSVGFAEFSKLSPELWYHACPNRTQHVGNNLTECPPIISRDDWGARPPSHAIGYLPAIPSYVFIHHGVMAPCHTESECVASVKLYQDYHMDNHSWWDIGYSFVVGEDGNIYEARGWDKIGAHTYGHNTEGIGICIIGNFMQHAPNNKALNAVTQLIQCGVRSNKIHQDYIVQGHCDVVRTQCPGTAFLDILKTWTHYQRGNNSYCPP